MYVGLRARVSEVVGSLDELFPSFYSWHPKCLKLKSSIEVMAHVQRITEERKGFKTVEEISKRHTLEKHCMISVAASYEQFK